MPTPADPSRRLLITAGPTHEPLDAVRYLANRSSGRLGLALTEAAARRGHRTTLLLGPTWLQPPESTAVRVIRFQTAAELQAELRRCWPVHDVLIMAAAVADFRPASGTGSGKITRGEGGLTLHLEPTPDLLADLAGRTRDDQTVIGFALEPPDRLEESARRKLDRKGVHAIVANPLQTMDAQRITAAVHLRDGRVLSPPPDLTKADFAEWLLDQLPRICGDER
ncbi:MAG: phosphopantothenoylcysteine decarboxylase [Planctomycetota bacterium]|nr:phosphopantothenoylcysteine decarboxylase [Planctomycetota bacterium]